MTEKIDLKKEYSHLYQPTQKSPTIIQVPKMSFLMIDGHGNPNTEPHFSQAVSALFKMSYSIKFFLKKNRGIDFAVMPLEGLWWINDGEIIINMDNKDLWDWTMMILQPQFVTDEIVENIRQDLNKKVPGDLWNKIRFQAYEEGEAVQVLHIGPFSEEGPAIQDIHQYALMQGYHLDGKHHEIYLSDITKAQPAKWRTVLRQPIRK